jgi:linoleoyl-CoA desaturase
MTTGHPIQNLRHEFELRGWTRKATVPVLVELFIHLTITACGVAVYFSSDRLLLRTCGMLLVTVGSMGVGTNTHTSSHFATSARRWVNELLTFIGYPLFLGLSATYWWHQHVVVHHPAPNVIGVDDDADLLPWFARTREEVERRSGFARFYYERLQWLALPLLLAANGFNMQKSGWVQLFRRLREAQRRQARAWIDLAALSLHYVCWLVIPAFIFGARPAVVFYLLRAMLLGYGMFAVLAPGHFPSDAICRDKDQPAPDYLLLQTSSTVNFRPGWIGGFFCSGLQYQVEHHLFPNLSHVYYAKASTLVRDMCRKQGLPYHCYSWGTALRKCFATFRWPPRIEVAPQDVTEVQS